VTRVGEKVHVRTNAAGKSSRTRDKSRPTAEVQSPVNGTGDSHAGVSLSSNPFPHLRRASPEAVHVVEQLRLGTLLAPNLPLDPEGPWAEALVLWNVEVRIVRWWASEVRRGSRRRPCPEAAAWSPATRQRYRVDGAYEVTRP
jgi:hypothetical protein